jgi:hypothetical protein
MPTYRAALLLKSFVSAAASSLFIHATVVLPTVTIRNRSTVNTDGVSLVLLCHNRPFIAMNVTRQYPLVLLLRQVGDSVLRWEVKKAECWEGAAGVRS